MDKVQYSSTLSAYVFNYNHLPITKNILQIQLFFLVLTQRTSQMAAGAQLDHPCSSQPGLLLKLNRYLLAVIPILLRFLIIYFISDEQNVIQNGWLPGCLGYSLPSTSAPS